MLIYNIITMSKVGRIYKIFCTLSDDVYVGSTFNELRSRFQLHKCKYQSWVEGERGVSIYPYFQRYGADRFRMILIKEYHVCDRAHLEAYEQLWISKTKCVNQNNTLYIKKMNKKAYREANKLSISESGKQIVKQIGK